MQPGAVSHADEPVEASGHSWREYRLLKRIGKGGSGEVWKAEAAGGFFVALKFVPLADRLGDRELRSLEILRTVRHPNLLVTHGAWAEDDQLVIAMELADGTLSGRFREAREAGLPGVPRDELLDSLGDAARAIDYLNASRLVVDGREHIGIQHRDIKPQNLLIVGGGTKVADLGVARLLDRSVVDHTGSWSFAYAAPEFFRNQTTRSSDQYSLAVTYCQLRTGRLPFSGSLAEVVLGQLMSPPDLTILEEQERAIVGRALSKEPSRRWPSCAAFIEALRQSEPGSGSVPEWTAAVVGPMPEEPSSMAPGVPESPANESGDDTWVARDWEFPTGFPEVGDSWTPSVDHALICDAWPNEVEWADDEDGPLPDRLDESTAGVGGGGGGAPHDRRSRIGSVASLAILLGLSAWGGLAYLGPLDRVVDAGGPAAAPPVAAQEDEDEIPADPVAWAESEAPVAPDEPPGDIGGGDDIAAAALADLPQGEAIGEGTNDPPVTEDEPRSPDRGSAGPSTSTRFALRPPADLDGMDVTPALRSPHPEASEVEAEGGPPGGDPPAPVIADEEGEGPRIAPDDGPAGGEADVVPLANPDSEPSPRGGPDAPGEDGPEAPGGVGPGPASDLNDSGLAHFLAGRPAEAIADLDAALAADPRHAAALKNRGAIHWHEGRYDEAIADFDAAIRIEPGDAVAYNNRGLVYRSIGDHDRAIADYDAAIRLQPDNAVLHYNRAQALALSGRDDEAIEALSRAIRLDPGYAKAYQARGEALARGGDRAEAEADLARARRLGLADAPD